MDWVGVGGGLKVVKILVTRMKSSFTELFHGPSMLADWRILVRAL